MLGLVLMDEGDAKRAFYEMSRGLLEGIRNGQLDDYVDMLESKVAGVLRKRNPLDEVLRASRRSRQT